MSSNLGPSWRKWQLTLCGLCLQPLASSSTAQPGTLIDLRTATPSNHWQTSRRSASGKSIAPVPAIPLSSSYWFASMVHIYPAIPCLSHTPVRHVSLRRCRFPESKCALQENTCAAFVLKQLGWLSMLTPYHAGFMIWNLLTLLLRQLSSHIQANPSRESPIT